MKPQIQTAGLCLAALALAGCSLESDPDSLTVSADVTMMVPADTAELTIEISGTATTRKEAMETIAKEHNLIKAELPQLDGITDITFEADELIIRRVPSDDCYRKLFESIPEFTYMEAFNDYFQLCENTDFSAYVEMMVSVQPAEMVGDVIAYATLSDVTNIELDGFSITNMEAARSNAKAEAAGKIRAVAENVADKTGVTLGRITKLSFRGATHFSTDSIYSIDDYGEIIVTGSRVMGRRDTVTLNIDPKMMPIEERVIATFEISD